MSQRSLRVVCLSAERTALQRHVDPYLRTLGAARQNLNDEERRAFASISARALRKAFAAEFVVLEAEEALRRAT